MGQSISPKEYWITNISKRGITLHDLNLTLLPGQSYNLLNKNARLTPELINQSITSGSICHKSKEIIIRRLAPKRKIRPILINKIPRLSSRQNAVEIKETHYEELDIAEENIANDLDELTDNKDETHE